MSAPFVDTNVLVRLLARDNPDHLAAAQALWTRVEQGTITLSAPDAVIADAVYVLSSPRLYRLPRHQVAALLIPLVRLPHFHVANRQVVLAALETYGSTNLDFGDAMIAAAMRGIGASHLYSFDTDFNHVPGIVRLDPAAEDEPR